MEGPVLSRSASIAIVATRLILATGIMVSPLFTGKPLAEAVAAGKAVELETPAGIAAARTGAGMAAMSMPPAEQAKDAASGLPAPGTPYARARQALLDQGMSPDHGHVDAPHPSFPELNCPGDGESRCRALFIHQADDGWRRYIVVETAGRDPVVTAARPPLDFEGLAAVPPPPAADIPTLPGSYGAARRTLLRLGFKPTKASKTVWSACAKALDSKDFIKCDADLPLPEIANCAGTGDAFCEAYWLAPDQRVLRVVTIGEPQPGAVYHMEWATPEQLAELPRDWKP